MPETHITTFYSFKGGVGRTMLLANVGAALALAGKKVLLVDLDVEAPGMHFIPALKPNSTVRRGFLEWLLNLQNKKLLRKPGEKQLGTLHKLRKPVPGLPGLHILPAFGEQDPISLYQNIDWHDFLVKSPEIGLDLLQSVTRYLSNLGEYHHILLDARTGVTDLGGLMTAILPHCVVLVGGYGHQNTRGLGRIRQALQKAVEHKIPERTLPALQLLQVVSPVPGEQAQLREARREAWAVDIPPEEMESLIEIPFDGRLLFNENLLVLSEPDSPTAAKYQRATEKIDKLRKETLQLNEKIRASQNAFPEQGAGIGAPDGRHEKGETFEARTAKLLSLLGYKVEREQLVDGNRVDIIARRDAGLRAECYLVECKDHHKPVGKPVLEKMKVWLDGDKARSMRAEAMVVAPDFSLQARTFVTDNNGIHIFTIGELESRLIDFGPYLSRLKQTFEESDLARSYVRQRVLLESEPEKREGVDLLEHGMAWAEGEVGGQLWLLLGDYGTGKTAFFKRFTYELAQKAEKGEGPVPISMDLKQIPNAISLESLLQEHLRDLAGWHGNPETILYLLEKGRVILLFDAFDEMGAATAGRPISEQFRQLARAARASGNNRVLITCRTHFFRDQQNVKDTLQGHGDHLIGNDSELGKLARSFDAAMDELLLFNQEQITEFLGKHLPAQQAAKAADFIAKTYDLPSLAPRPVLLEMIIQALPKLMRCTGQVTPAGLYHRYTTLWLEEKSGNNLLSTAAQRKKLLELLARDLWNRPGHRIHYRELNNLITRLESGVLAHLVPERVDMELRTAAFLIRSADGYYTFSHKCFREFFFARALLSALRQGDDEFARTLNTEILTPECVAFFADLLNNHTNGQKNDAHSVIKNALTALLGATYVPRASENGFFLALHMARHFVTHNEDENVTEVMRDLVPDKMQLQGAKLGEMDLAGAWLTGANMRGADLSGCDLTIAQAGNADFSGANLQAATLDGGIFFESNFNRANLAHASLREVYLSQANLSEADCTAAVLVGAKCRRTIFTKACCHATRFARSDCTGADFTETVLTAATAPGTIEPPLNRVLPSKPTALPMHGHSDIINSVAFDHNSQRAVTASADRTAIIWDIHSRKQLQIITGHKKNVGSAVFNHDSKLIVTTDSDRARIWDIHTGQQLLTLEGHKTWIRCATFSHDSKRILTASADKTAIIWDATSGQQIYILQGHDSGVHTAAFSHDSKRVVTASDDTSAIVWDANSGKQILRLQKHESTVHAASFSHNSKRIITASQDRTAIVWDANSGKQILVLRGHNDWVISAKFSHDSKFVITGSFDKTAIIWDAQTGKQVLVLKGHKDRVLSATFSHNSKHVITAGFDKTAIIRNAQTGKQIQRLPGHGTYVLSAKFSHDSTRIITSNSDKTAIIWDTQAGKRTLALMGHKKWVFSACLSHNSKQIITASDDATAIVWDATNGKQLNILKGHKDTIRSAAFSHDSARVITASDDATAIIWDIKTGQKLHILTGHNWVTSAAFNHDSKRIVTGGNNHTAIIWDAQTGKQISTLEGHKDIVSSVRYSHESKRIVTASFDCTAIIWDANTTKQLHILKRHAQQVVSAAFSHDSRRVITASYDGTAIVWNAKTTNKLYTLKGHTQGLTSAEFSHDSKRIVTASYDGTAIIWDAETGEKLLTMTTTPNGWYSLDKEGRYRSGGDGLKYLGYKDPEEKAEIPTIWDAEDLPEMRADK